jgi:hypothetical protein
MKMKKLIFALIGIIIGSLCFAAGWWIKAVQLFKTQSSSNSVGVYSNYPIQRPNQTKSLLSRFYPL